jgi:hypothetical protein
LVHVLAPSAPPNLTVNPSGCSQTNSFAFNWTPPDNPTGIGGYEWQVDGTGSPSPVTAIPMTTTAPSAGNHTFYVRAYNLAGNRGSFASVGFCYQPLTGPCTGREISHSPCRQPGDPCLPAQTASLQTLPDLSASQWMAVGQPVGNLLQPNLQYSLGFEYRSTTGTDVKLRLGGFNPNTSNPDLVIGESTLPVSANDWKTFWSAPFTVTPDQLKSISALRLIRPKGSDDGIEYRNVRILAYRP